MNAKVVELRPADDFKFSGNELPHGVTDIWAMPILGNSEKAHFFIRKAVAYVSLCNVAVPHRLRNGQNYLFGPGSYPKCKRCMDRLRRG